jgi:ribosomal protein S12 methylthiotransferase
MIERIRKAAPAAATRSSFIIGYPGETDDDVEELVEFLREAQLDWAGFFPYSAEEGTDASTMPDQVASALISERMRYVQEVQDEITTAKNSSVVGRTLRILVDQIEDGQSVGRSYREAPEIDGLILLDGGEPGEWVTATIVGAYGTDLSAMVVSE